jgi:hypothetical protein
LALVEAVALRKRARLVPTIPQEVIHAFDSVVRDGAYFIKYNTASAPHERFFQVRFVDVQGHAPEPCISWSAHRTSWSAKGIINLAAIKRVGRGTSTKAFARQLIDDRRIRGPMIGGPHRAVLPTVHAFWLELNPQLIEGGVGGDEASSDALSLLSLHTEVFHAWTSFLNFLTLITPDDVVDDGSAMDVHGAATPVHTTDDGRCSSGRAETPQSMTA